MKDVQNKIIRLDIDFIPILDKFIILANEDKRIIESIPDKQRKLVEKCGIFSHAVRFLITSYVTSAWPIYAQRRGIKIKKEVIEEEKKEDDTPAQA